VFEDLKLSFISFGPFRDEPSDLRRNIRTSEEEFGPPKEHSGKQRGVRTSKGKQRQAKEEASKNNALHNSIL
jgi:hypothetical protein